MARALLQWGSGPAVSGWYFLSLSLLLLELTLC